MHRLMASYTSIHALNELHLLLRFNRLMGDEGDPASVKQLSDKCVAIQTGVLRLSRQFTRTHDH